MKAVQLWKSAFKILSLLGTMGSLLFSNLSWQSQWLSFDNFDTRVCCHCGRKSTSTETYVKFGMTSHRAVRAFQHILTLLFPELLSIRWWLLKLREYCYNCFLGLIGNFPGHRLSWENRRETQRAQTLHSMEIWEWRMASSRILFLWLKS